MVKFGGNEMKISSSSDLQNYVFFRRLIQSPYLCGCIVQLMNTVMQYCYFIKKLIEI